MIVVNFKNFRSGVGNGAIGLARICEKVGKECGVEIVAAVSALDVSDVSRDVGIGVWLQHVDGVEYGAYSGWILPELAKERGARGAIINHSEHKLLNDEIRRAVARSKQSDLATCVCADSLEEAVRLSELEPDYIAYEPAELIGNRDKSVSSEKGERIGEIVKRLAGRRVLIGAGVHSVEDIRVGLKLGARGFLVASDAVLAADPEKELRELAGGFGYGGSGNSGGV